MQTQLDSYLGTQDPRSSLPMHTVQQSHLDTKEENKMIKVPTSNAFIYEALGLKAASAAFEKTMLDILKTRDLSNVDKLIAIKNLQRHQSDLEMRYQITMSKVSKENK